MLAAIQSLFGMNKLEIGYKVTSIEVRREAIVKDLDSHLKVMYLSDLHLNGYSSSLVKIVSSIITEEDPDLILFGGDYVDTKSGLSYLSTIFSVASITSDCTAVIGNHDRFFGVRKIAEIAKDNNVKILDSYSPMTMNEIQVGLYASPMRKCDMDLCILLLHEPVDPIIANDFDITLAGHLHGCQFIFWEKNNYLYPGKLFYKNNFTKKYDEQKKSYYFISKGLADTLPIRYNCSRDILVLEIK